MVELIPTPAGFRESIENYAARKYRIEIDADANGTYETNLTPYLQGCEVTGSGKDGGISNSYAVKLRNPGQIFSPGDYAKKPVRIYAGTDTHEALVFTGVIEDEGLNQTRSSLAHDELEFKAFDYLSFAAKLKLKRGYSFTAFYICNNSSPANSLAHWLADKLGLTLVAGDILKQLPVISLSKGTKILEVFQRMAEAYLGEVFCNENGELVFTSRYMAEWDDTPQITINEHGSYKAKYQQATIHRAETQFPTWTYLGTGQTVYQNLTNFNPDTGFIDITIAEGEYWPSSDGFVEVEFTDPLTGFELAAASVITPALGSDITVLAGGSVAIDAFEQVAADRARIRLHNDGTGSATITKFIIRGEAYRKDSTQRVTHVDAATPVDDQIEKEIPGDFFFNTTDANRTLAYMVNYGKEDRRVFESSFPWFPDVRQNLIVSMDFEGATLAWKVKSFKHTGGRTPAYFRTTLVLEEYADEPASPDSPILEDIQLPGVPAEIWSQIIARPDRDELNDGSLPITPSVLSAPTGGADIVGNWAVTGALTAGSGANIAVVSGDDSTYRFWAGAVDPGDAPFSVEKDGKIHATAGEIGGWIIGTNTLESDSGDARIVLDKTNNRVTVFGGGVPTVAMGYLGGLSDPNNRANTLAANIRGFWAEDGDTIQFYGNATMESGSFKFTEDSVIAIENALGNPILTLGSYSGIHGLHFENGDGWDGSFFVTSIGVAEVRTKNGVGFYEGSSSPTNGNLALSISGAYVTSHVPFRTLVNSLFKGPITVESTSLFEGDITISVSGQNTDINYHSETGYSISHNLHNNGVLRFQIILGSNGNYFVLRARDSAGNNSRTFLSYDYAADYFIIQTHRVRRYSEGGDLIRIEYINPAGNDPTYVYNDFPALTSQIGEYRFFRDTNTSAHCNFVIFNANGSFDPSFLVRSKGPTSRSLTQVYGDMVVLEDLRVDGRLTLNGGMASGNIGKHPYSSPSGRQEGTLYNELMGLFNLVPLSEFIQCDGVLTHSSGSFQYAIVGMVVDSPLGGTPTIEFVTYNSDWGFYHVTGGEIIQGSTSTYNFSIDMLVTVTKSNLP